MSDESAKLLWAEFEYRHKHFWTVLLQLTIAASSLSALPYVDREVTMLLGRWILTAPILATVLSMAGGYILIVELYVFKELKDAYRKMQKQAGTFTYDEPDRCVGYAIFGYVAALVLCSFAGILVTCFVWIPAITARNIF